MKAEYEFNGIVNIGKRAVGKGLPCYIIAEIGVNFNGNLELAKETIQAAAECKVDAVKFQTFDADEFVADRDLSYTYHLADGTQVTETQYDMFKRLELPYEWHNILQNYANQLGLDFLSSTADRRAVDALVSIKAPALKLASEDLINIALLEYVAQQQIPVILSTGMADLAEIQLAVDIFASYNHWNLVLLHCTSSYPTPPDACNLRKIISLSERFSIPIGFSDHTEGVEAAMLAVTLGACLVEKHFTLDHSLPGPDHKMSANPSQLKEMVAKIRLAETMLGSDQITFSTCEEKGRQEFRRSIVAGRPIAAGEVIMLESIAYKRPGYGLKPYQREMIIGKRAIRDLAVNDVIQLSDIQ